MNLSEMYEAYDDLMREYNEYVVYTKPLVETNNGKIVSGSRRWKRRHQGECHGRVQGESGGFRCHSCLRSAADAAGHQAVGSGRESEETDEEKRSVKIG